MYKCLDFILFFTFLKEYIFATKILLVLEYEKVWSWYVIFIYIYIYKTKAAFKNKKYNKNNNIVKIELITIKKNSFLF